MSWLGIRIANFGGAENTTTLMTISNASSANTLTLGASGFDMAAATQALSIQSKIAIGANQNWVIANANTGGSPAGFNNGEAISFNVQAAGAAFNFGGKTVTTSGAGLVAVTSGFTMSNGTPNIGNNLFVIQGGSSRLTTLDSTFNVGVNSGGTLRLQSNSAGVLFNATINLNGGTLNFFANNATNAVTLNGNINVIAASAITVTGGANGPTIQNGSNTALNYTFSGTGKISGGASLTKTGNGTLTLANTIAYDDTGGTAVSAGTLQVGDGVTAGVGILPTGTIVNDGTISLNRPDNFSIAANITGSGTIAKNNTNIVTFPNSTTLGNVAINAGGLKFTAGGIVASGGQIQVKFNTNNQDAVLNLGGNFTATGNVAITNAGYTGPNLNLVNLVGGDRTFNIAPGTTTTVAPAVSGVDDLIRTGGGTLTLNGLQDYATLNTIAGTTNLNKTLGTGASSIASTGTTNIAVSQTIDSLDIGDGGAVVLGIPVPAPAPEFAGNPDLGFGEGGVQPVPEPASASLLLLGALGLFGRRRW